MEPQILRAPWTPQAPLAPTSTPPSRLLAFAVDGERDEAVLILDGVLDVRSGQVLTEAFFALRDRNARRTYLDLSGIRSWNAAGMAKLLECGAACQGVAVRGAGPHLAAALSDAQPDWEILGADGLPRARRASDWARRLGDALGQSLDVAFALALLVLLLPVLVFIGVAIKLDSTGPVVYTQLRAGRMRRNGTVRVFKVFKFRTMHTNADDLRAELMATTSTGPFFKLKADPRVTRSGRILRATSLDELPQLLNILRGEMRLVGNRPLALDEASRLVEPWQRVRFRAPAGLTGLWQVSGRNEASDLARLALDTAYAAARTPLLDLRILLATVPAVVLRKGW